MYIPKNMKLTEMKAISTFISEFGFGTLISPDMEITRTPLLYDASAGSLGRIVGHMAKANPQWQSLTGQRVSIVFDGPHSYISPTWYDTEPAVPTWNYASVQCFGVFKELDGPNTWRVIKELVRKYEPEILDDSGLMPDEYVDKLLKAVVGFEVEVCDIQAKEKLGQHRNVEDQKGVFEGLSKSNSVDARQLAKYMKSRNLGCGSG